MLIQHRANGGKAVVDDELGAALVASGHWKQPRKARTKPEPPQELAPQIPAPAEAPETEQ